MKYLLSILCLFVLSCDDDDGGGYTPPDANEGCYKIYDELDGSFIDCNSECMYYSYECYHMNDVDILTELRDYVSVQYWNESEHILDIIDGNDNWNTYDYDEDYGRLKYLDLGDFELTNLPQSIGNLSSLEELHLYFNQLTSVPESIWNLSNLTHLYLGGNQQLTGSIPPEIGNLTNLYILDLFGTQFTGEIPSEIGNLTNLTFLYLNENQLSGEIPQELGNLINLNYLYLYDNQLSGEIPEEICNINYVYVGNNQLCPPYPECISQYDIEFTRHL